MFNDTAILLKLLARPMVGPEIGAQRNPLHEMGQCVCLDRGYGQGAEILGSLLFAELAAPAQPLRQKSQSADGGSFEIDVVLLGYRSKRVPNSSQPSALSFQRSARGFTVSAES